MESIAKFKTELRNQKDIRQVPKHFEIGPRKLDITLTVTMQKWSITIHTKSHFPGMIIFLNFSTFFNIYVV
jgi:hypothetical protein